MDPDKGRDTAGKRGGGGGRNRDYFRTLCHSIGQRGKQQRAAKGNFEVEN